MRTLLLLAALVATGSAMAAPVRYTIDPGHTYPSFAADHFGGLSTWRGKFNHTHGTVTLDAQARTGTLRIVVDTASIDFGNEKLNKVARGPKLFDVAKYPKAVYTGTLGGFVNGKPTRATGKLALHGITRPLSLKIDSFKCVPDPLLHPRKRCGADATASFDRDAFGIGFGKAYGFRMKVTLHIQVEAVETADSVDGDKS